MPAKVLEWGAVVRFERAIQVAAVLWGALHLGGCGQPITSREARSQGRPNVQKPSTRVQTDSPPALVERALEAGSLPEPRRQIVEVALAMTGAPAKSLDCSSFAQQVYATTGQRLPRTVREQLAAGERISSNDVRPGDLIFFAFEDQPADHVGIYTGEDSFVHVSSSTRSVRLESLSKSVFSSAYVASRRFLALRR